MYKDIIKVTKASQKYYILINIFTLLTLPAIFIKSTLNELFNTNKEIIRLTI